MQQKKLGIEFHDEIISQNYSSIGDFPNKKVQDIGFNCWNLVDFQLLNARKLRILKHCEPN